MDFNSTFLDEQIHQRKSVPVRPRPSLLNLEYFNRPGSILPRLSTPNLKTNSAMANSNSRNENIELNYIQGSNRPDTSITQQARANQNDNLNEIQDYSDYMRSMHDSNDDDMSGYWQHRVTSIHRNATVRHTVKNMPSRRSLEGRCVWMASAGNSSGKKSLEQHANNIASHMEQDSSLMEDSAISEHLRREALKDMPQCLTIKRIIKSRLVKSVSQKSKSKPLSLYRRFKYRTKISLSKMKGTVKNLTYSFELWYSTLKIIEGHFGSGVATYFKFLRWLFLMNCLIMLVSIGFVVVPQLIHVHLEPIAPESNSTDVLYEGNGSYNNVILAQPLLWNFEGYTMRKDPFGDNEPFQFFNIFTGTGFFTNTTLFYGYYSNETIGVIPNTEYSMPYAYFFTMFCLYIVAFIVLSVSMARMYRHSFIETQGGLKNVFAHKIFCGWDFGIATEEAANLKCAAIYNEIRELLSDIETKSTKKTFVTRFWTKTVQIITNIVVLILLTVTGYILWLLLSEHRNNSGTSDESITVILLTAVIINVIMMIFPVIFSFIVKYEDYKNPRIALFITLGRMFLLSFVVIGVLIAFWLIHSQKDNCWETSLGQEIYRLILFDFLFSVLLSFILEFIRIVVYKKLWQPIGLPEFDIARYTLAIIYNQTLFWVGFYFSPLLSLVVVIKLWLTWYTRRTSVLNFCKASSKSWRAAQTETWFLILTFISLLLVIVVHGYIMVKIPASYCGPFKSNEPMYSMIIADLFKLREGNVFWQVCMYVTKPGVIALILVAMCVRAYYLRAKAVAQRATVAMLRRALVTSAIDKEFLLKYISRVTEGQWQYNLQDRRRHVADYYMTQPNIKEEDDDSSMTHRRNLISFSDENVVSNTSSEDLLTRSSNSSLPLSSLFSDSGRQYTHRKKHF